MRLDGAKLDTQSAVRHDFLHTFYLTLPHLYPVQSHMLDAANSEPSSRQNSPRSTTTNTHANAWARKTQDRGPVYHPRHHYRYQFLLRCQVTQLCFWTDRPSLAVEMSEVLASTNVTSTDVTKTCKTSRRRRNRSAGALEPHLCCASPPMSPEAGDELSAAARDIASPFSGRSNASSTREQARAT